MQRTAILLFGVFAYAVFLATFLYLVAFVGNLPATALGEWLPGLRELVPRTIDAGGPAAPVAAAVLIDLLLVLAFGVQHSAMARSGFKGWLRRRLPPAAERSVYVLVSSLLLVLLFWQWRPLPQVLWSASTDWGQLLGWVVFAAGFGLVLLSTFLIDHFDLFGLKQVWRQWRGQPAPEARFVQPLLYRIVRHPLYLGFLLAFWGGPLMTTGHLLFALVMSAYILVAIRLEERDLVRQLGEGYATYRSEVPMLVPGWPRPRRAAAVRAGAAQH